MLTEKRRNDLAVKKALKKAKEARAALAEVTKFAAVSYGADNDLARLEASLEALSKLRGNLPPKAPTRDVFTEVIRKVEPAPKLPDICPVHRSVIHGFCERCMSE